MLKRVLDELRQEARPVLSKADLSRRLGVDESALDGMLEQLVRRGYLRKVQDMAIEECQSQLECGTFRSGLCAFLTSGMSATYYEIVDN